MFTRVLYPTDFSAVSDGRSQVAEILLGSVTEGVLRRAHVPVLAVTPRDRA